MPFACEGANRGAFLGTQGSLVCVHCPLRGSSLVLPCGTYKDERTKHGSLLYQQEACGASLPGCGDVDVTWWTPGRSRSRTQSRFAPSMLACMHMARNTAGSLGSLGDLGFVLFARPPSRLQYLGRPGVHIRTGRIIIHGNQVHGTSQLLNPPLGPPSLVRITL